jgi:Cu/Ag efflux protein CusF
MTRVATLCAGLVTVAALAAAPVLAQQPQQPPKADCQAKAPQKVDGQVVNVDRNSAKVTVKDTSGTTHEFQTSKETAQTMKPGDKIEATLREAPKC